MHARRSTTVAVLAAAAVVATAVPAWAHAGFDVRSLPAGATETFELRVPIEIDSANAFVDVLVPSGWTVEDCAGADSWRCETAQRDAGETVVNLTAEDDGAGATELFALEMTAPTAEGTYSFPVVQTYEDGTEAAWIGEEGGDRPAPRIQVGDDDTPVERSSELPSHGDGTAPTGDAGDGPLQDPSTGTPTDEVSQTVSGSDDPTTAASSEEQADDGSAPEAASADDLADDGVAVQDDDGLGPIAWGLLALVVLGIGGVAAVARR